MESPSMALSHLDHKHGVSGIIAGNAHACAKSVEVPLQEAFGSVNQDFQSFADDLLGYSSVTNSANSNTSFRSVSPLACDKDKGKEFPDDSDIYERVFEDQFLMKKGPKILKMLLSVGVPQEMVVKLLTKNIKRLKIFKSSDIKELEILENGFSATFSYGKWRSTEVLLKRTKEYTGKPFEEQCMIDLYKEACTLDKLCHPCVLGCYGFLIDDIGHSVAMVAEFMFDGSLRNALQKKLILEKHLQVLILLKVAYGMGYLHRNEVVHYDLKPENVFVELQEPGNPLCKIGNLGKPKANSLALFVGNVQGSLPWMAPELFCDGHVSEKVDVFSFGIMMWEVLTGQAPYSDLDSEAITRGIVTDTLRPPVPESCDPCWKSLMERCWSSEPSQRPSFTEIVSELCAMEAKLTTPEQECPPTESQIEK